MARVGLVLGFVLTVCVFFCWAGRVPCPTNGLVQYSAIFMANWTKERFPKQFPEFRPPAQFSRVVGLAHNSQYRLFQIGAEATPELKLFVETAKQEILGNGFRGVLDEFLLPAVRNGSGKVWTNFVVDRNHSQVSMVARIIPSPDWFVGIDSLDLCADGHWIDTVTIEASPIDAGTDSGFTFTAPNWETVPQETIYKITSQYPRHPANSFYYPHLTDLPPLATFQIFKKRDNFDALNEVITWKDLKKKRSRKKKSSSVRRCQVSEWSEWSACNGPCGQSQRTRNLTKPGLGCPPLLQERTCGCTKYIFNW